MAKETDADAGLDFIFEAGSEVIAKSEHPVIRNAFDGGADLVRGSDTNPVDGVGKILQWFSTNESLQIIFEVLTTNFDGMFEMINTERCGVMQGFPIHTVPLEVKTFKGHRGYEHRVVMRARQIIIHPLGYVREDGITRLLDAVSTKLPRVQGVTRSLANTMEALRGPSPSGDPFNDKKPLWNFPVASFVFESADDDKVETATFAGKVADNKFQIARVNYSDGSLENPIKRLYPKASELAVGLEGAVGKYCGTGEDAEQIAAELTAVKLFEVIKAEMGVQMVSSALYGLC